MVHHTPWSTNLAWYVVSEKGVATRLLIVLEVFHKLMFFHRLWTDRMAVRLKWRGWLLHLWMWCIAEEHKPGNWGPWRLNLTLGFGFVFTRIMCFISKNWSQMWFVFVCSQFHHSVDIHSDILNMLWSLWRKKVFRKNIYFPKHSTVNVTVYACIP